MSGPLQRPLGLVCGWAALLCTLAPGAEGASCGNAAACQERMRTLMEKLQSTEDSMRSRKMTMHALEGFRNGLMHGERVHLPSAQRQHLEKGSPLVGEVSYDAKHRPLSTNVSKHMKHVRSIMNGSNFRLQGLLPVKRPGSGGGSTVLIATLEGDSKLSLTTTDGETRLSKFDLGHRVSHMSLSVNTDHNYVLTGDDSGELRVLMVELVMRNASADGASEDEGDSAADKKKPKKQLAVVANTTATFSLPSAGDGRKITSVLAVDRSSQPLFLAGDSHGSVAVFFKNGTLKGRIKVTDDPGGVLGFRRGQGQTVLFFSSHSFGFLSVSQVDVSAPPCTGWNSPVFDVASDPQSSYSRVTLALSDGDVLVFSTSGKTKDKSCDLTLKFPRISQLPFRMHTVRGHVMGLPTPLENTQNEHNRELYFFNVGAMEGGYGSGQSRAVTLQASFHPRRLESFALQNSGGGGSSGPSPKLFLALQFTGEGAGLELYELNLKTPAAPAASGGGGSGSDLASWLDWIPKVGILGVTLIGVVIWNVRKVSGKNKSGGGGGLPANLQEDMLMERLRKKKDGMKGDGLGGAGGGLDGDLDDLDDKLEAIRAKTKAKKAASSGGASGSSGLGGLDGLDLGGLDLDADMAGLAGLGANTKAMEELLASMGGGDD